MWVLSPFSDFYVDVMELSVLRRMLLHVDIAIAAVFRVNTNSKSLNKQRRFI